MKTLIEKQKEYIEYLEKAINNESILRDITYGVREKFRAELFALEAEKKDN